MKDLLEDIARKLRANDYRNEEHVRLSLVARILQALGWNIWDPREVNTEFGTVPAEDSTRVDIALFTRPIEPAVFIEVKNVGKISGRNLQEIERQLRDYNRNILAAFCVLTDGRYWRFYLSRAPGEFSQKLFKVIDLLSDSDSMEDIELTLHAFLSKDEILSERALREAEKYLNSTKRERAMSDALPVARRDVDSQPTLSQVQALVRRVAGSGYEITEETALNFIQRSVAQGGANEGEGNFPKAEPNQVTPSARQTTKDKTMLRLKRKGEVVATGYLDSDGRQFLVLSGATMLAKVKESGKKYLPLRNELKAKGLLRSEGDELVLLEDYSFSSISAAASFLLGVSANGHREWNP